MYYRATIDKKLTGPSLFHSQTMTTTITKKKKKGMKILVFLMSVTLLTKKMAELVKQLKRILTRSWVFHLLSTRTSKKSRKRKKRTQRNLNENQNNCKRYSVVCHQFLSKEFSVEMT